MKIRNRKKKTCWIISKKKIPLSLDAIQIVKKIEKKKTCWIISKKKKRLAE